MISYFKYGKGNLTICEDSLTSAVFDLLKYLPTDLFWHILRQGLHQDNLPSYCGEVLEMEYWAKWNAQGKYKTRNKLYVEPDLFMRFKDFDLIIEAKRYNINQQNPEQLQDEIRAYLNEYEDDNKTLYLLQVGGLINNCKEHFIEVEHLKILQSKTDWSSLLKSINTIYKGFLKQNIPNQKPTILLLEDIINSFSIHGFHQKKWLKNCAIYNINTKAINSFNF
ncbi:hypothetical protein [Tenacibaculum finnmarkense]|uniref:hypothetical protein n=1 Tax=Tenacibaculum finnmarkense TaxID=2781243 RepID=UPI001E4B4566|nr:hypothetical protein [Tenacibaculum finnmarkense]MCD8438721.1 hypothetical protein [Tenacibaculum finnmarkense genomovar ulcerans]MCG8720949.1 hypothetical protein [Tenacibaculum finnmarkense]